jgi:hypothetical protein
MPLAKRGHINDHGTKNDSLTKKKNCKGLFWIFSVFNIS